MREDKCEREQRKCEVEGSLEQRAASNVQGIAYAYAETETATPSVERGVRE